MNSDFQTLMNMGPLTVAAFFAVSLWLILWKGFGLWISAREGKPWWFVAILILNTFGLLEIIYIVFFSETGKKYIAGFKKHRAHKKSKKDKTKDETQEENI